MITITQARYEELLDSETRVDVLCDLLVDMDLKVQDIFNVLGMLHLISKYESRCEKEHKEREEWLKGINANE